MAPEFWPWWAGAMALAIATLGHLMLTGRPMGVIGAWAKVVHWRSEKRNEAAARALEEQSAALQAATDAQFGILRPSPTLQQRGVASPMPAPPLTVSDSLVFLLMLVVGGAVSAMLRGSWGAQTGFGGDFAQTWGDGPLGWMVLVVGGICTGFGTRLSGGCTSGHGLMGCSRLQIPSLVATVVFVGTAVAVSLIVRQAFG